MTSHYSVSAAVLIDYLRGIHPRTSETDAVCLALRALGSAALAERYADAAARMAYWDAKPSYFEFLGAGYGDPANTWTDEEYATSQRDEAAYWAVVQDIRAAYPETESLQTA